MESLVLIKVFAPTALAFTIGILLTPVVTHFLYKHRVWKKAGGKQSLYGTEATEFNRLKGGEETKTPRMGGIVIWASVLLTVFLLFSLKLLFQSTIFNQLDFFSRSQTWIPLATLCIGAFIGWLNDYYDVTHTGKGIRLRTRIIIISLLAGLIGWWFYTKLGVDSLGLPFATEMYLGLLIIPFFILFTNALYASGVIDGIDGLSGGVFSAIFSAYAGIAFIQSQYDLAALSATIAGAILAFLWFNIPPARFWMTETGSMALTLTLAVIVLMTDNIGEGHGMFLFLIVGLPLIATVASNVIQISYRRATGRKFFRIAPLHHHFEAIGWPSYKVTMRYWVISIVCAIIGISLASII
jgi:phospho-N-acetylmuramoyl-pentapeptide-transferase